MDRCRGRALPHLLRLAKCVLLIPPVTVECERLFSWKRWVQDDRCKNREISVLAALCHIFMDHRKGRNGLGDDDAFAVLQKLGVAPRLRTGDRGKIHVKRQRPGERKNAKNRKPLWDKDAKKEEARPETEEKKDDEDVVGGDDGVSDGSHSSESDAAGGEDFLDEEDPETDSEEAKFAAEMEAAQLAQALEDCERDDAGLPKLDPLKLCNVCNLAWNKHPRATSSTQCPVCKHWTHDSYCFPPDQEACRKCSEHMR